MLTLLQSGCVDISREFATKAELDAQEGFINCVSNLYVSLAVSLLLC